MEQFQFSSVRPQLAALLQRALFHGEPPKAVVGLDGYVDHLYAVVRQTRTDGTKVPYTASEEFVGRLMQARGQSVERELVCKSRRAGGNAPLTAMGLATLGVATHCIGFLGGEHPSPAFDSLRKRCEVTDLGVPAQCMAFEFADCKFMFSETQSLQALDADALLARCGRETLVRLFADSRLIAFLNWAGLTHMTRILETLRQVALEDAVLEGKTLFFDFSDISARSKEDFTAYARIIGELARRCAVTVSLNENEARQAVEVLLGGAGAESLPFASLRQAFGVQELVIHGMGVATAVTAEGLWQMNSPLLKRPAVAVGGGDHFNSGYCAAKLAGLSPALALALANATTLYYVSHGEEGTQAQIAAFLQAMGMRPDCKDHLIGGDWMETYLEDVFAQPESLRQCVQGLREPERQRRLLALCGREYSGVIFTGMGSSNYCSVPANALLLRNGKNSCRYSAAELLHYHLHAVPSDALLVINSQSGESAEIVRLLEKLPPDVTVIAVSNDPQSTLAKASALLLPMSAQAEESVTTRTYLASIVIDLLVAQALLGLSCENFLSSILKVLPKAEELLQNAASIQQIFVDTLGFPPQLCLIGRGCSTASTQAGALFLREIVRYPAFSELGGEFRHGPMEMVDDHFYGVVIAADDATAPLSQSLAADIQRHGGHVVAIANEEWAGIPTVVVPRAEEWLSPLLTILPIQLYADSLAKQKGIRPGCFRWGSKITRTE